MSRIQRFEEIVSWQKARDLTSTIYEISKRGYFLKDFALRDQIRRAAVSVMANIAEGFDRDGNREFGQFLSHAKSSCAELQSHLYVAWDQKYMDDSVFNSLYGRAGEINRLIGGLLRYLRQTEKRGRKFIQPAS